jgi:hypothetical protein
MGDWVKIEVFKRLKLAHGRHIGFLKVVQQRLSP